MNQEHTLRSLTDEELLRVVDRENLVVAELARRLETALDALADVEKDLHEARERANA